MAIILNNAHSKSPMEPPNTAPVSSKVLNAEILNVFTSTNWIKKWKFKMMIPEMSSKNKMIKL